MEAYPTMLLAFLIATALGPILVYLYMRSLPDHSGSLTGSFSPEGDE
jgi:hypothetical protein